MKVELFGISKTKDNETINVFFKTPKKFIYDLMFYKEPKYEHKQAEQIYGKEVVNELKKFGFDLNMNTLFIAKEEQRYNIRFFSMLQKNFKEDITFKEFSDSVLKKSKRFAKDEIVELYEFVFSEEYKVLSNEKNINFKALSDKAKSLYKEFKKGII